jgi:hypothetical protein
MFTFKTFVVNNKQIERLYNMLLGNDADNFAYYYILYIWIIINVIILYNYYKERLDKYLSDKNTKSII